MSWEWRAETWPRERHGTRLTLVRVFVDNVDGAGRCLALASFGPEEILIGDSRALITADLIYGEAGI